MSETSLELIKFVLYRSLVDNVPHVKEHSFHHFVSKMKHEIINDKTKGKGFSPILMESDISKYPSFVGEKTNSKGIVTGHYYQNKRGQKVVVNLKGQFVRANINVRGITMIVFDFDQGDLSPNEVIKRFEKYNYCIYTTYSHQNSFPKLRVILPLSEPLLPKTFIEYWPILQKWCGNRADESCKDPARFFFLPACSQISLPQAGVWANCDGENLVPEDIYKKFKALEVTVEKDGSKTSRRKPRKKRGDYTTLDAVAWFGAHSAYYSTAGDDKHFVECPWKHEHTDGVQGDTDTVLWVEKGKWPTFNCSHNICSRNERNITQVMAVWPDVDDFCKNMFSKKTMRIKVEVICLGFDDAGMYWYQNSSHQHIVGLKGKEHSELSLYTVCPERDYWYSKYGDDDSGKIDWKIAASDLINKCHKKGFFKPQYIRGTGVWRDDNRVVAHLGEQLIVNGVPTNLRDMKSLYTYEATVNSIKYASILNDRFSKWYYKAFHFLPIEKRHERVFLAGCAVAGLLSGYLKWRPHCWLTGDGGSGKTQILKYIIAPLWRPIGGLYCEGETTAAGIRQETRNNALPVMIDESESNSTGEEFRIQALLRLARSASSDSDAQTLKGTAFGRGVGYTVRSVFLFSSISESLQFVQDKERFSVIRCKSTPKTTVSWPSLRAALDHRLTREFSYRLFSRSIALAPTIAKNVTTLSSLILKNIPWSTARWADQIAHLVCCAVSLNSTDIYNNVDMWKVFEKVGDNKKWYNELRPDKEDSDTSFSAIQNFMAHIIQTSNNKRLSIGEIVDKIIASQNPQDWATNSSPLDTISYQRDLERHGVKYDGTNLIISSTHQQTRRIFSEYGFTGHAGILSHFSSAKKIDRTKFGPLYTKAVSIPLTDIQN